jgi:hypothetical protein
LPPAIGTKSTESLYLTFCFPLNADVREQCNQHAIGKTLKGKNVELRIAPQAQQNDEP